MDEQELWERAVDGLYITLAWGERSGWTVNVVAHREGCGWQDAQRSTYDRLTLPEAFDVVAEETRTRRGF